MAAHRAPHKAVEAGEWQKGPDWNTGICECLSDSSVLPGNTTCCVMCCLSVFGCDYWLWKDIDEWYEERKAGVEVTYPSTYTPPAGSLEAYCGHYVWRSLGCLATFVVSYATCDLVKCYYLARQRRQVRQMYGIPGSECDDFCSVCCCRACTFSQLQQQLEAEVPGTDTPPLVNSMTPGQKDGISRTGCRQGVQLQYKGRLAA